MLAKVNSVTIFQAETQKVQVEVNILPGQMQMHIIGLADHAVRESRERIRSAITNSGFHFPVNCIVVNLYPNDVQKMGALCEFAIATAILIASEQISPEPFEDALLLGSLSLDGTVGAAKGMLSGAIFAFQNKITKVLVARHSCHELRYISGVDLFAFDRLEQLQDFCAGRIKAMSHLTFKADFEKVATDMSSVRGLHRAKKALAFAIIGGHHTLLIGPPGTGKTLICKAAKSLLPKLSLEEALEVSQLYSSIGLNQNRLVRHRPFREPHHTCSEVALVGGGTHPRPGEISLAHKGVLFLDELLEFQANTLQSLREPLQEGQVLISRTQKAVYFLADFTLVAATNPCRCGFRFVAENLCTCRKDKDKRILDKIIGPFLDRITLEVEVVDEGNPFEMPVEKNSIWWREKIEAARARMKLRNGALKNAHLSIAHLTELFSHLPLWQKEVQLMARRLGLSNRALLNSLRLAVTVKDFYGESKVSPDHLNEAFAYRMFAQVAGEFKRVA